MNIISLIVICAGIAAIVILWDLYEGYKYRRYNKISFKEALDLTDLPIITFESNGKKLNFLLDTGSTVSHINSSVLNENSLEYKKTDEYTEVSGLSGITKISNNIILTLYLNNKEFSSEFLVSDMSVLFTNIKEATGVTVHGIIGTPFFNKYKYVIDFDKYVAYSKRR